MGNKTPKLNVQHIVLNRFRYSHGETKTYIFRLFGIQLVVRDLNSNKTIQTKRLFVITVASNRVL